jgi:hypothetical protein
MRREDNYERWISSGQFQGLYSNVRMKEVKKTTMHLT